MLTRFRLGTTLDYDGEQYACGRGCRLRETPELRWLAGRRNKQQAAASTDRLAYSGGRIGPEHRNILSPVRMMPQLLSTPFNALKATSMPEYKFHTGQTVYLRPAVAKNIPGGLSNHRAPAGKRGRVPISD